MSIVSSEALAVIVSCPFWNVNSYRSKRIPEWTWDVSAYEYAATELSAPKLSTASRNARPPLLFSTFALCAGLLDHLERFDGLGITIGGFLSNLSQCFFTYSRFELIDLTCPTTAGSNN